MVGMVDFCLDGKVRRGIIGNGGTQNDEEWWSILWLVTYNEEWWERCSIVWMGR